MIKSKEEAQDIGRKGEKHAYVYLKNKYTKDRFDVYWPNEVAEAGFSHDFTVYDIKKRYHFIC